MVVEDKSPIGPPVARRHRWCRTLICLLITLLILITLIITLFFTVFKVKPPIMTLNKITVNRNSTTTGSSPISVFLPGSNISLTADASVKNPNPVEFRFSNSTTSINYKGIFVGQGIGAGGRAGARRTVRMNITLEIETDRVIGAPDLGSELGLGLISMDSYTRVPGEVKMVVIGKRDVVVEMNCRVRFNITSQKIQDQSCKSRVDFKL